MDNFEDGEDQAAHHNQRPVRKALSPPYYYGKRGDNPQTFIATFEQISRANSWDDTVKLSQFPSYLRGFSQQWRMKGMVD